MVVNSPSVQEIRQALLEDKYFKEENWYYLKSDLVIGDTRGWWKYLSKS